MKSSTEKLQTVRKSMLIECQNTIKQLQSELQYALKINSQKDQIIQMLTEEKQFYLQQTRKFDEKTYGKLKEQINWNSSLTNALKQHNKQLSQKCNALTESNQTLMIELNQKQLLLKQMHQEIESIKQDKKKLQNEWNNTLVCVRKKIFELNNNKAKIKNEPIQQKKVRYYSKAKTNAKGNTNEIVKNTYQKSKVQNILQQIDDKLLNYEFLEMIQSKQVKNNLKNHKQQIFSQNQSFNNEFKGKNQLKSVILKMSELELDEDKENVPAYLNL